MPKHQIKLHDVYKSKHSSMHVEIIGKKGSNYKARILTNKHDVYAGSHTFAPQTIFRAYILVDKKTFV